MEKRPQLTVYKASAGSGKTWRLTVEYLKLLLQRPDAYRHILAVTFTNKAAGEMKERVLDALQTLSQGHGDKAMLETIARETGLNINTLQDRANEALNLLIHDYSRFHIETIDSFFQIVLRNLARELGLGSSFNIDLDTDTVLEKAVARMYANASDSPTVLAWIKDYIEEQIYDGRNRNVEKGLREFGQNIFKERFQQKWNGLRKCLENKGFLDDYRKRLHAVKAKSEKEIRGLLKEYETILSDNGLTISDFAYGETGPAAYFVKRLAGDYSAEPFERSRLQTALADPAKWGTKKSPAAVQAVGQQLTGLVERCEQLLSELYPTINSADLTLKHLYKVGLLSDIAAEVDTVNLEENRFMLSNTGALLNAMVDGSDAPFIFEKIGVDLEHMMIDEFQDTSHIQWDNFKPLMREGLAGGHDSLLVGDEKQSIYRFRNGDWRILGHIDRELPGVGHRILPLDSNFRSERAIVDFNNAVFPAAIEALKVDFEPIIGKKRVSELSVAYSSIVQKCPKSKAAGYVDVEFLSQDAVNSSPAALDHSPQAPSDKRLPAAENANDVEGQKSGEKKISYEELTCRALVNKVALLQRQGIRPEQMAILVRTNKHIPLIAGYFARYAQSPDADPSVCYEIISDEAFLLGTSMAVRALIAALRVIFNPDDNIAAEELKRLLARLNAQPTCSQPTPSRVTYEGATHEHTTCKDMTCELAALRQLPLMEMVERVQQILGLDRVKGDEGYLFTFMDQLTHFVTDTSADLGEFLTWWDDELRKKAIPMGTALNGIRILSIHKSKGLQYHTVIVPFADWKLLNQTNHHMIWCEPAVAPFNELPLVPIDYNEKMADSIYADDYREESLQLLIENLNTLYVAFTRAEKNLVVLSKDTKPGERLSSVSQLLSIVLQRLAEAKAENGLTETPAENGMTETPAENGHADIAGTTPTEAGSISRYETGTLCTDADPEKEPTDTIHLPFVTYRHRSGFRQSNRARAFVRDGSTEDYTNHFIEHGKLMHYIFENIRHPDEARSAVRKAISEGLLAASEEENVCREVDAALGHPVARQWWTGDYTLYNECSILFRDPQGQLVEKRPDRVIRRGNDVEVVDYKFGTPRHSHVRQVQQYMKLLGQMGFGQVRGWLWYVDAGEVRQVDL